MKRPGTTGLLILLAFSVPVIVEFHTVLAMAGIEIPMRLYLAGSALVVVAALVVILALPKSDEDESRGNVSNV